MMILFDLDGTLLDTAPDFAKAINRLREKQNLSPLSESKMPEIRLAITEGANKVIEVGLELSSKSLITPKLVTEFLDQYESVLGDGSSLFPGIDALLTRLETEGIPWGVVTNKQQRFTDPLLTKLNLKERAACIVSGDTTPYSKPHPAPLLCAAESLNIAPNHCVYVGDAERDIMAGKAAGMITIGALFGYIEDIHKAKHWNADHYVHHANEIFPWVNQWLKK